MNWIDFAWPMMGGACLALGLIHLLVWVRHRSQTVSLLFCLIALTVAVLAVCELLLMRAQTPAEFASLLRWTSIPASMLPSEAQFGLKTCSHTCASACDLTPMGAVALCGSGIRAW